jgi:ABC-type antimicrobial peptide transport system permease subunit
LLIETPVGGCWPHPKAQGTTVDVPLAAAQDDAVGAVPFLGQWALRRYWRTSIVLALLVGLGIGAALGAAAGARRTASAFPRLVDELRPSDVTLTPTFDEPLTGADEALVAGLPEVRELRRIWGFGLVGRTSDGRPDFEGDDWFTTGGPDGLYPYRGDRPKLTEGVLPPEDDPYAVAINRYSAERDRLGVGDAFPAMVFDVEEVARVDEPETEAEAEALTRRYFTAVDLRVTGVYERIEEISGQAESADDRAAVVSRAFAAAQRRHLSFRILGVDLRDGSTADDLQATLRRRLPDASFDSASGGELLDGVDRSVAPVVGALWALAGLMGLATVLVVGQAVARSTHVEVTETAMLGPLGMTRRERVLAAAARALVIAIAGAIAGAVLAVATSWLFPLAPVEHADPDSGVRLDGVVLAIGVAAGVVLLTLFAAIAAWRGTAPPGTVATGRPGMADSLARTGLPTSLVTGVRLALQPDPTRRSAPAGLTVVGAAVAITAVVGALGFGSSLHRLIETPERYGWTWDALVYAPAEVGDAVAEQIADDEDLAAVTEVANARVTVAGRTVFSAGFEPLRGGILPTVTRGSWPAANDEVALGGKTMRRLDLGLGDRFPATGHDGASRSLRVVGQVLFPVVLPDVSSTADVGEGMALTRDGLGAIAGDVRPSSYLVDFAPGGRGLVGLRSSYGDLTFGPQQPPDIRNYERVRPVPIALATLVGLLGAAMLASGLVGLVRTRRRDLGVLETLGFGRRQIRWVVVWQATTLAGLALALGLPAGVVVGRQAWEVLADRLAVPAEASTSLGVLAVAAFVTLALTVVIAVLATARAGRLRPAVVLRTE